MNKNDSQQNDNVYYNVSAFNNTEFPKILKIEDTRSQYILDKPENYRMSLIRWTVNTVSIPLFFFKTINDDRINIDNTFYRVKLSDGIVSSTANVIFVKNNINPIGDTGVYYIQDFVNWINSALLVAYNNPPSPWDVSFVSPPYIFYNQDTKSIGVIAQQEFYTGSLSLFVNNNLHSFFPSLAIVVAPTTNLSSSWTTTFAKISIGPTKNNLITFTNPIQIGAVPKQCFEMYTPQNTTYIWNSLKSIIFTSSLIPCTAEYIQNKDNTITNKTFNIISDYEVTIDNPTNSTSRTWFQYNAQIYRYIDLFSTQPLNKIDLQVYWSDYNNNIYPLYSDPGTFISAKILFERKK